MISVTNHATTRFRIHHPSAEESEVLCAFHNSVEISAELALTLMQRLNKGVKSRYFASPDRRGLFVYENNTLITYLRMGDPQHRFLKKHFPLDHLQEESPPEPVTHPEPEEVVNCPYRDMDSMELLYQTHSLLEEVNDCHRRMAEIKETEGSDSDAYDMVRGQHNHWHSLYQTALAEKKRRIENHEWDVPDPAYNIRAGAVYFHPSLSQVNKHHFPYTIHTLSREWDSKSWMEVVVYENRESGEKYTGYYPNGPDAPPVYIVPGMKTEQGKEWYLQAKAP